MFCKFQFTESTAKDTSLCYSCRWVS